MFEPFPSAASPRESLTPSDHQTLQMLASLYGTRLLVRTLEEMDRSALQLADPTWENHESLLSEWSSTSVTALPTMNIPSTTSFITSPVLDCSDADSDTSSLFPATHCTLSPQASPSAPNLFPVDSWPAPAWPETYTPTCPPLPGSKRPQARTAIPRSHHSSTGSSPRTPPDDAQPSPKPISCPLCSVHDIPVGFGRKSDLKKHLYRFHGPDHLWLCPVPGCNMAFDLERAYAAHARTVHETLPPEPSPTSTPLPRRTVFACGFESCKTCLTGPGAAERYFDHVAGHFHRHGRAPTSAVRGGEGEETWCFSTQMRNLLRQPGVREAWKAHVDKAARGRMRWRAGTSGVLRAMLETGRFRDVEEIVRAAASEGGRGT